MSPAVLITRMRPVVALLVLSIFVSPLLCQAQSIAVPGEKGAPALAKLDICDSQGRLTFTSSDAASIPEHGTAAVFMQQCGFREQPDAPFKSPLLTRGNEHPPRV